MICGTIDELAVIMANAIDKTLVFYDPQNRTDFLLDVIPELKAQLKIHQNNKQK